MINFDQYRYYPSLRSRMWELRGYSELHDTDKEKLLPIFVLSKLGRTKSIKDVCASLENSLDGRARILDLELSPIYSCDECSALSSPDSGFSAWRNFLESQENAIPTALMPPGAPVRDVVRQVMLLEQLGKGVVVRSRSPVSDLPLLTAIMSAVESINNLLIILDFGYVRSRVKARAVEAANVINALRDIDTGSRLVTLASSYPKSAAAYDDAGAAMEIEERTLHSSLGGDSVTIYGDYASIHPEPFEPMQTRFVPRIDYSLPDAWVFRRVRADQGGFQRCAELITQLVDWDPNLVEKSWGAQKIKAAAEGDLTSMNAPAPWIAVRVNLHLWQQVHYGLENGTVEYDEDIFG